MARARALKAGAVAENYLFSTLGRASILALLAVLEFTWEAVGSL